MRMNWKKIGILTADIVLGVYLVLAITAFNCPDDKDAVCREVNINITDNAGKKVYEKAVHTADVLALNIDNTFYGQNSASKGVGQAKAVLFFILVAGIGLAQLAYTRKKEVQQ